MPDYTGPKTYLEKLQFAQRVIRGAKFRNDQKQALRELCEGVYEVVMALLEREGGLEKSPDGGQPGKQSEPGEAPPPAG
jgi:hypothetical protein